jgi:hypothetical protein
VRYHNDRVGNPAFVKSNASEFESPSSPKQSISKKETKNRPTLTAKERSPTHAQIVGK